MKPAQSIGAVPIHRAVGAEELGLRYGWGLAFFATPQLRTPLRVLTHHGERFDGPGSPPRYARELWEGVWTPYVPSWKELGGADIPDFQPSAMASDIGPIPHDGIYHAFLVRVRQIVETIEPIRDRLSDLRIELARPVSAEYCDRLGGAQAICDHFFPMFLYGIKGLTRRSCDDIAAVAGGIRPVDVLAVPDEDLLRIKGIGPARLSTIREACLCVEDPFAEHVDCVNR